VIYSIYYYYCNDAQTLLISNKTELLINRGGVRWSWKFGAAEQNTPGGI